MTVSIVVPTYRGAHRLPRLLTSLAHQDDADFEVVVVVDGDEDGSTRVLARSASPWLRALVLPENRGRAVALNAGLSAAHGEIVARVDDDLELPPGFVAAQHRLHAAGVGAVVGTHVNVYPDRTAYARAYGEHAEGAVRTAALTSPAAERWRFWGGNVSVRREDLDRVGPYDESFRRYGWEDVDWGYRLHLSGRRIVVSTEVETRHHAAATTAVSRALRAFESGHAQVRFEDKHGFVVDDKAREPESAWERLVARAARGLTPAEIRRRGDRLDASLRLTPRAVARKRVALLVEAAARAGYLAAASNHTIKEPHS